MKERQFAYHRKTKHVNEREMIAKIKSLPIPEQHLFIDTLSIEYDRQYRHMKQQLRKGDTLYISSLSALGRKKETILTEWRELMEEIQVHIVVLDAPVLDTRDLTNSPLRQQIITDLVTQLLSWLAVEEDEQYRKSLRDGIEKARSVGRVSGPRKNVVDDLFRETYSKWKRKEITAEEAQEILDIKKSTFYRLVNEYKVELKTLSTK